MFFKDGAAVLETRETNHVPGARSGLATPRRAPGSPRLRRDLSEDFRDLTDDGSADAEDEAPAFDRRRRRKGVQLTLRGGMPQTRLGRILAGVAAVSMLGISVAILWGARQSLLHDRRFAIPSSSAIQIAGNSHMTRAQLLSVFGEDVDRNVLTISLEDRKAELERLPWVEHATVMRLLPNRIHVSVVERTPVAFYRQGGHIGLVDANGVLLNMSEDTGDGDTSAQPAQHYSFPVVTGIGEDDPLSTRAARMKIYMRFIAELNQSADKISDRLSEVDLSSPEDVKALIPSGKNDVLVHFGDGEFLERYRRFEENLPKWQADYPKLASADMRYPRQVVLEMQAGSSVPMATNANPEAIADKPKADAAKAPVKTVVAKKPVVRRRRLSWRRPCLRRTGI
ncbi:FtsQ-type POTRA domain-containing protein [Granulicella sp. WH15]|uniref:cell division protein FtsQ/DivIB n=1 Tax=Granulicella sp. WH15 TaxID=2602070 RepID=UPI001367334F|nr:FtsQ-type POTRA domain-containing protein [Granulicella sp. WH15]QHN04449.1 FtsQ-type POTRA domain-containing protein [Granulicella sp. WH15]